MRHTGQQEWIPRAVAALESEEGRRLIKFLQRQRWFGGKGKPVSAVHVLNVIPLSDERDRRLLVLVSVGYPDGHGECYAMPLAVRPVTQTGDADGLVEFPLSSSGEWICDATREPTTWISLYEDIAQDRKRAGTAGWLSGRSIPQEREALSRPVQEAKLLAAEQSNTSVVFDRRVILKLIRKVETGINPDSEMLEFLTTQTACSFVPPLMGLMTYERTVVDGSKTAVAAIVQRFVSNSVDGWGYTLTHLDRLLSEGPVEVEQGRTLSQTVANISGVFLAEMRNLGGVTGALHLALASRTTPEAFRPEPITQQDVEQWQTGITMHLTTLCRDLRALQPNQRSAGGLADRDLAWLDMACSERFGALELLPRSGASKIRHHGDYHLGQILKTDDGFLVIDFEGEPARSLEERRAKLCPLKDVGGMLRSFNYAAQVLLMQRKTASATQVGLLEEWERTVRAAFLEGYRATATPGRAIFLPATWEEALRIIQVYELDKALYELEYEMRNRPDWLSIPLQGIRRVMRG